jgi:hypothetical protein
MFFYLFKILVIIIDKDPSLSQDVAHRNYHHTALLAKDNKGILVLDLWCAIFTACGWQ